MSSVVPGVRHPIALLRVCLGVAMFWAWAQETALLPAGATYTARPLGGGGGAVTALPEVRRRGWGAKAPPRPFGGFPGNTSGVAVGGAVAATKTPAPAGVTVAVAAGPFVTEMGGVPFFPSLVAVIVAGPAAT